MRVVAGIVYALIVAVALRFVWPSPSPPSDMTPGFLLLGWMGIGFVVFSVACAAGLSARLRGIGQADEGEHDITVGAGMLIALLTAPLAFVASVCVASVLTSASGSSIGLSGETDVFTGVAITGTAAGTVLPYLWLGRRAGLQR